MANVFRDQCRWYPTPAALVDAGHLLNLSASALRLYIVLLRLAQKHSAIEIELPGYELRDYTGLDHKSITKAGRELETAGLVGMKKERSVAVATYQLLNPETARVLPTPEGRKGVRKHHPKSGRSARTARSAVQSKAPICEPAAPPVVEPRPLSWDEIGAGNRAPSRREIFPSMTGNTPYSDGKYSLPCMQKQEKTGELQEEPLSEYISERKISEHSTKASARHWNPNGFECYLHGKQVDFEGAFCLLCHPEVRSSFKKSDQRYAQGNWRAQGGA